MQRVPSPSPTLPGILRSTLEHIAADTEINPDDSSLRRLKLSILRALAELEVRKANAA